MARLGLETDIIDRGVHARAEQRVRDAGIALQPFAELADPARIPAATRASLAAIDPDAPHPLNLFRVHWYNDASRKGLAGVPAFVELPEELSGVKARIWLLLGH